MDTLNHTTTQTTEHKYIMNGTFNSEDSWEKAAVYDLDNGWQAVIQHSLYYGDFVTRLSKDGKHWLASDGYDNPYGTSDDPIMAKVFKDHIALPDFARPWIETTSLNSEDTLVRPKFTRHWKQ